MGIVFTVETEGQVINLTATCPMDGKETTVEFPMTLQQFEHCWKQWERGAFVQQAFPGLDAEHREFLITALAPEVQAEIFAPPTDY